MVKRSSIWIAIILFIAAVGLIALLLRPRASTYKGPLEELSFGTSPAFYSLLFVVAEERGLFAQNGLQLQMKEYEYGALALEHLMKGDVEMAVAADFAFVNKSFENDYLRIVASIGTSGSEEIVARKDSKIEQIYDLKGKRIGVSLNTSSEFTLMRFLLFNGIMLEEVTLVDLGPALLVDAVANGDVDAIILWDKWVHEAQKRLGAGGVSWPARIGQDFYWLVITTRELIEKKPAAVERFLRAIMQAEEFVKVNRAEAKAIFTRRCSREPAYVDYAWERSKFNVSLDQGLLTAMAIEADWRLQSRHGKGESAPNYFGFIYMDALDRVKPGANTILR
jgi:NitT/TauT family transport system substrate-binding protein